MTQYHIKNPYSFAEIKAKIETNKYSAELLLQHAMIVLESQQWQPIETAPKDGTAILVTPGLWNDTTCSIARYDTDKYSVRPRPFWSRSDDFGRVTSSREKPPTGWMPLPPPKTAETNLQNERDEVK